MKMKYLECIHELDHIEEFVIRKGRLWSRFILLDNGNYDILRNICDDNILRAVCCIYSRQSRTRFLFDNGKIKDLLVMCVNKKHLRKM